MKDFLKTGGVQFIFGILLTVSFSIAKIGIVYATYSYIKKNFDAKNKAESFCKYITRDFQ